MFRYIISKLTLRNDNLIESEFEDHKALVLTGSRSVSHDLTQFEHQLHQLSQSDNSRITPPRAHAQANSARLITTPANIRTTHARTEDTAGDTDEIRAELDQLRANLRQITALNQQLRAPVRGNRNRAARCSERPKHTTRAIARIGIDAEGDTVAVERQWPRGCPLCQVSFCHPLCPYLRAQMKPGE
ncbi:hypothetical protein BT63DRAFT_479396 [Microthyrium microscopicum]|uniref:Uncharacterized protein n=1 Tax=Microthyrium microscopicum TaxID=703497 RepID=A0A6A6UBG7_9PEZI|nr:hypothetical protein BT63DRAFT_479396 [Microthyrium microscopicum]